MGDVSPETSTSRTTARSTDGPGRWLPATVLALSVAAVAVGCAGGGVPGQDGTATSSGVTPTPGSTPTATSAPDAPTTEPAAFHSVDGERWQAARTLRSTDRLLVTGSVCESQRRLSCSPQVWASPGGDTWERKALPGDGQPEAVTRTADGQLVVVGRGPCPGGCPEGVLHAAAAWVTAPIVPTG